MQLTIANLESLKNIVLNGAPKRPDHIQQFVDIINGSTDLKNHLRQIGDFATKPEQQVFYEVLQNAADEEATKLLIYLKEDALVVVNNGTPFKWMPEIHDTYTKSPLISFLSEGKSSKQGGKGVGEKGVGSKLLYNLLADRDSTTDENNTVVKHEDKKVEALYEQLQSIQVFSWGKSLQLDSFLKINKITEETLIQQDAKDSEDAALLVKTLFVRYPALPFEHSDVDGKENLLLYKADEIQAFQKALIELQAIHIEQPVPLDTATFQKGTALFIPLGKGVAPNIREAWHNSVKRILPFSMFFFKHVESIHFKDGSNKYELIAKHRERAKLPPSITLTLEDDEIASLFPLQLEDSAYPNLYKYAPVTEEVLGWKFVINADFTVINTRQSIKDEAFNVKLLESINDGLQEKFNNNKKLYQNWFPYLLSSRLYPVKGKNQTQGLAEFERQLYTYVQNNLPTRFGLHPASQVLHWPYEDAICPSKEIWDELGAYPFRIPAEIPEQEHNSILDNWEIRPFEWKGFFEQIKTSFALRIVFQKWLKSLDKNSFHSFWEEAKYAFSQNPHHQLAIFRSQQGSFYSLNDLNNPKSSCCYAARYEALEPFLKGKNSALKQLHLVHQDLPNAQELIEEAPFWAKLKEYTAIGNYNTNLKLAVWEEGKKYVENWPLFKNADGVFVPHGNIIWNKAIRKDYGNIIPAAHRLGAPDSTLYEQITVLSPKKSIFKKILFPNWEDWLPNTEMPPSVIKFYELLGGLLSADDKSLLGDKKVILTASKNYQSIEQSIAVATNDPAQTQELFQRLGIDKQIASPDLYEAFFNNKEHPLYIELRLSDLVIENTVSKEDCIRLAHLVEANGEKFFYHYYLRPTLDNHYKIVKRHQNGPRQIYTDEPYLKSFLKTKEQEIALPTALNELADYVRYKDECLAAYLIDNYGYKLELAPFIERQERESRGKFIGKLDTEDIQEGTELHKALVNIAIPLMNDSNLALRQKLKVGGLSLEELRYEEDIEIKKDHVHNLYQLGITKDEQAIKKALQLLKSQYGASWMNLLSPERMSAQQAYEKLKEQAHTIQNQRQFVFLVDYMEVQEDKDKDFWDPLLSQYASQYPQTVLTALFERNLDTFYKFFEFNDWAYRKMFYRPPSSPYLLAEEWIPEWLREWINQNKQERLSFLKRLVLRVNHPKDKHLIDFRKSLLEGKPYSPLKEALEAPSFKRLLPNTLQYLSGKSLNKSCFYDLQRIQRELDSWPDAKVITYQDEQHIQIGDLDQSRAVCHEEHKYQEEINSRLKQAGYQCLLGNIAFNKTKASEVELDSDMDEDNLLINAYRWPAKHHTQEWNEKFKTIIYISKQPIQYKFSLAIPGQSVLDIEIQASENHYKFPKNGKTHIVLAQSLEGGDGVERYLGEEKNLKEGIIKNDALIQLMLNRGLATSDAPQQGISATGMLGNGSGNYDASELEQDVVNQLRALGAPEEFLRELAKLENLDDIWKRMKDVVPNQKTAFQGEALLYRYLLEEYPESKGYKVLWTSRGEGRRGKTNEYDFLIQQKGQDLLYIDAKTTRVPEKDKNSNTPFYVRQSQLQFLNQLKRQKRAPNYLIVRLSLWDAAQRGFEAERFGEHNSLSIKDVRKMPFEDEFQRLQDTFQFYYLYKFEEAGELELKG